MDGKLQLKLAMLVRVEDFLRAYPFGDEPADQVVARFMEKLARFRVLVAQQQDGTATRTALVGQARQLRKRLSRGPLRHLEAAALALEVEEPTLAAAVRLPRTKMARQPFLAAVRSVVQAVEANAERLRGAGMSAEVPADLATLLASYEQAIHEKEVALRAHTGARAELTVLGRALMGLARQLDAQVSYRFADKPELQGAWTSARNVAWPVLQPAAKPAAPRLVEGAQA